MRCIGFIEVLLLVCVTLTPAISAGQNSAKPDIPQKRMMVSVVSVDIEHKAIQVEEIPSVIVFTTDTVFDEDVRPASLKTGARVEVVGSELPDGRILASQLHSAKPKSQ